MKRKGFTLTELVVAIAVSSVVLSSLLAVIASVVSFNRMRNSKETADEETTLIKEFIIEAFSGEDSSDSFAPEVKNNGNTLSIGDVTISFDEGTKNLKIGESIYHFETTDKISFFQDAKNPNLIKCVLNYSIDNKQESYTFMLLKRSINKEIQ